MPPVLPENAALQQAVAEASARLRAQIQQDQAALRQVTQASLQFVQDVRRERAAARSDQSPATIYNELAVAQTNKK